jgi:hypothetical protein
MTPLRFTILAQKRDGSIVPPRTKKNTPRIVRKHSGVGRPILLPSAEYEEWERAALSVLIRSKICARRPEGSVAYLGNQIVHKVACRALVYRKADWGDACGYYQAIGDLLERAGIVSNDRLIVAWDGSRLLKDPVCPRVEVELTPFGEAEPLLEGL